MDINALKSLEDYKVQLDVMKKALESRNKNLNSWEEDIKRQENELIEKQTKLKQLLG